MKLHFIILLSAALVVPGSLASSSHQSQEIIVVTIKDYTGGKQKGEYQKESGEICTVSGFFLAQKQVFIVGTLQGRSEGFYLNKEGKIVLHEIVEIIPPEPGKLLVKAKISKTTFFAQN